MTNHVRFSEICLSNYGMIFIQVEGASERAVIEILKANNVLKLNETQIYREYLRREKVQAIERYVASHKSKKKNLLIRIVDSPNEKYRARRLFADRYDVCTIVTNPEIEVLIIFAEGLENNREYLKSEKPSIYLKTKWPKWNQYRQRHKSLKSESFFKEYFADVDDLIRAILKHSRSNSNEYDRLKDLLKD